MQERIPPPASAEAIPAGPAYSIGAAGAGDLAAIRRLLISVHFDARGLQAAYFLVARTPDGCIVGCAQIKPMGGRRVLSSVVIDPAVRQHGVAGNLIRALLIHETGPVVLMCLGGLVPFYETFGFRRAPLRQAPGGLYWRLAALTLVGLVRARHRTIAIMVRPEPALPNL